MKWINNTIKHETLFHSFTKITHTLKKLRYLNFRSANYSKIHNKKVILFFICTALINLNSPLYVSHIQNISTATTSLNIYSN